MRILVITKGEVPDTVITALLSKCEQEHHVDSITHMTEYVPCDAPEFDLIALCFEPSNMRGVSQTVRETRKKHAPIPIIVVLPERNDDMSVRLLRNGASDVFTMTLYPGLLEARFRKLLRERTITEKLSPKLSLGNLTLDVVFRRVLINKSIVDGKIVRFTKSEFEMLYIFLTRQERVVTREQFLGVFYPDNRIADLRTVDSHIKRLRRKLIKVGLKNCLIQTIYGVGYQLVVIK